MDGFSARALIVDDESDICELISMSFMSIGIECVEAYSVSDAIVILQKQKFDLCITDLKLPDDDGFALISYVQENFLAMPIAMMTAHGNVQSAVEALKRGAFDFISKPFDLNNLRNIALSAIKASRETDQTSTHDLLGNSEAMQNVRSLIKKFARSQAPVFIQGESGTGKELAARAIHAASPRKDAPFIAVNCGAIPEHLVESEFFGHKKGSFTGADKDKIGLFQAAHSGTLFLDEIADLPLLMQVKLLRAIQERAIREVGGTKETSLDIRIISATHKGLEKMVTAGEFREDLFYRLNVINLNMPPLRICLEDLPILCLNILKKINNINQTNIKIGPEAIIKLRQYNFPGNVRELENILERACVLSDGIMLVAQDFNVYNPLASNYEQHKPGISAPEISLIETNNSPERSTLPQSFIDTIPRDINNLEEFLNSVETIVIRRSLKESYNKTQAAEKLGVTFRSFRHRIKKLGIED